MGMQGEGDFVEFFATGDAVVGQYRCSECAYGVSIQRELPLCPMCGGTIWEELVAWGDEQPLH